jgi:phospholipid/cholesterol/gamma-HCH transport system substrate-binding protein
MRAANSFKAGVFFFAFLVAFAGGILLLGKERQIFAHQELFVTSFYNIGGLVEGAPVRLGGITIGRVDRIGFSDDPYDPTVKVRFTVNDDFLDRIRKDSEAAIETQGLLGDKYLLISSGMAMASQPPLDPGSYIKSREPADFQQVLTKAQMIVDNTEKISKSVFEVMDELKKETLKNVSDSARGIADLVRQIETGEGLMHRIFYSKKDGEKIMHSLTETSENLDKITSEVRSGSGLLNALIYDPKGKELIESLSMASASISKTADELNSITTSIREGNGVAHHLIYGESVDVNQKISSAAEDIHLAANALRQAAEALSKGEGTIGALLVDGRLYDNLVNITDGAQRSFILRQAVKSALNSAKKD